MENLVAIYAAVVGSIALSWQIFVEIRRRRTSVLVRVEEGFKGPRIVVVNRSEHPVRVVAGGLESADGSLSVGSEKTVLGNHLLGVIPSKDGRFASLYEDDVALTAVAKIMIKPMKAWVQISTGEVFMSAQVSYEKWAQLILNSQEE